MPNQDTLPEIIRLDVHQPRITIDTGEIHLYVMDLGDLPYSESDLVACLNTEEEARASRFINPDYGMQYRCIRGMLRNLLAHYLNTSPAWIEFSYAEHGKPSLRDHPPLRFNLSHSSDMAAFAFCLAHEVGVDIEYMREQKNLAGMIRHVGSQQEQAELNALQEPEASQAFYRLWTRKEAFIKAMGRGLGMGLRSIHIGCQVDPALRRVEYKGELLPEWFIQDISPPEGYKLALCSQYSGV